MPRTNTSFTRRDVARVMLWASALSLLLAALGGCEQASQPPAAASPEPASSTQPTTNASQPSTTTVAKTTSASGRPKLLDLGAGKCIPCKMMMPILDQLRDEYAGKVNVEFVDVWKNPDVAKKYGVETIPTQIFFDASGKEVFRHTGFFPKEEILKKWKELGIAVKTQS